MVDIVGQLDEGIDQLLPFGGRWVVEKIMHFHGSRNAAQQIKVEGRRNVFRFAVDNNKLLNLLFLRKADESDYGKLYGYVQPGGHFSPSKPMLTINDPANISSGWNRNLTFLAVVARLIKPNDNCPRKRSLLRDVPTDCLNTRR